MDIVGVRPAKTFNHEWHEGTRRKAIGVLQGWDTLMTLERLLECQPRRSHFQSRVRGRDCGCMAQESTNEKDNLRVEKLSLLVLTLCIVVLVYVLVARPF